MAALLCEGNARVISKACSWLGIIFSGEPLRDWPGIPAVHEPGAFAFYEGCIKAGCV